MIPSFTQIHSTQLAVGSAASFRQPAQRHPIYAKLPAAPRNASPVPHLTSLYHFSRAGEYGRPALSRQLRRQSHQGPAALLSSRDSVFDPMTGSGTCRDVCRELAIPACLERPARASTRATRMPLQFSRNARLRLHLGASSLLAAEDLHRRSRATCRVTPTLDAFLDRYAASSANAPVRSAPQRQARHSDGRLLRPRGRVRLPHLPHQADRLRRGPAAGCTDIIRFSHGASSSRKSYRSSFIPGLHDVCMIFEKR